jgi:hypothetical protein
MKKAMDYWGKIKADFDEKRLLLLGEKHGSNLNPEIIKIFVEKLGVEIIMLELETKWQKTLNLLPKRSNQEILDLFKVEGWILESGLISFAHFDLFREYIKEGKKIVAFKIEGSDWNKAEKLTTDFIEKFSKNKQKKIMVVTGNLHARKRPFKLASKEYRPLGWYLASRSISVRIRYSSGLIYNFGKKSVNDKNGSKLLPESEEGLISPRSVYFDYDYILSQTSKPLFLE